jgi:outer membrane protein
MMTVIARFGRFVSVFVLALALLAPGTVSAQQGSKGKLKPPVIAVLDMRVIMRESIAGKAWQAYYEKQVKGHRDEIAAMEKQLRPAWDELQRQKTILAPQAFEGREREFRQKEAAANGQLARDEQQLSQHLQRTFHEVQRVVLGKLRPIRDRIVAEKGLDMVIFMNPDMNYLAPRYDITREVLVELNRALPKLDVQALAKKAEK